MSVVLSWQRMEMHPDGGLHWVNHSLRNAQL